MGKLDKFFDWLILQQMGKMPGAIVAATMVLLYPGVALVLPICLGWSVPWLVDANLVGAILAGCVGMGWLILQVRARDRLHLLEWTSDLRLLDAAEFEWLVGELFRREGWTVEETGRQDAPDGNIDLRLRKGGESRIVQCKRWTAWQVGVDEVRAFAGTLAREHLPTNAGVFVTTSTFTGQARDEALILGLGLVEGADLVARIEKVRRAEPCPKCAGAMRLARSPHGWWFRCPRYPDCDGKCDLSPDFARAVELLTRQA
jgi:restriction system protein